eukprot:TRINITY_DN66089_c4_g1_i1.p1 TRINITY_DN66089_c4_g1~~TRINITY_DN66089_c4_g1_i1.p1  ORF type:complete len:592 (-),score=324.52 TRINITY_DN66089_c4_g1_i1:221-1996(-)
MARTKQTARRGRSNYGLGGVAQPTATFPPPTTAAADSGSDEEDDDDDDSQVVTLPTVSVGMSALLFQEELSDVTFVVEGERVFAHRLVLATRSEVFRAMLYPAEQLPLVIEVQDTKLDAFKLLLTYLYTDRADLTGPAALFGALHVSRKYCIEGLRAIATHFMTGGLKVDNCCVLLETVPDMAPQALSFICDNADDVIRHPSFLSISKRWLMRLLKDDRLGASEADLFIALVLWGKAQLGADGDAQDEADGKQDEHGGAEEEAEADDEEDDDDDDAEDEDIIANASTALDATTAAKMREVLDELLPLIRFPLLSSQELALLVSPSQLLDAQAMLSLFTYIGCPNEEIRQQMIMPFSTKPRSGGGGSSLYEGEWSQTAKDNRVMVHQGGRAVVHNGGCLMGLWCRAEKPLPSRAFAYYEVLLTHNTGCYQSMGVSLKDAAIQQNTRLGLNDKTWVVRMYNNSNDRTYNGAYHKSQYKAYNNQWMTNDRVSVLIDMRKGTMTMFRNGQDLGVAHDNLPTRKHQLYPIVELCHNSGLAFVDPKANMFTPKRGSDGKIVLQRNANSKGLLNVKLPKAKKKKKGRPVGARSRNRRR